MSAGLPGVGLGAILYLILILAMPFWRARLTEGDARWTWRAIARHILILAGMVGIAALEGRVAAALGAPIGSILVQASPFAALALAYALFEAARQVLLWRGGRGRRTGSAGASTEPVPEAANTAGGTHV
jgi:hypothetical protein